MVNEDGFIVSHQFTEKDIVKYEILETHISSQAEKSKFEISKITNYQVLVQNTTL